MSQNFANAWAVEEHGRRMRRREATMALVAVAAVFAVMLATVGLATRERLPGRLIWVFVLAVALCLLIVVIRIGAHALAEEAHKHDVPVSVQSANAGGTVICCSGGGIKSASFCLGGLAALDDAGLYRSAEALVAVSGGGYAASAFSAMARQNQAPFRVSSPELHRLRNRTNYLAGDPRTRFELAASLLLGLTMNVLMLGATGVALVWVVVNYSTTLGLGSSAMSFGQGAACDSEQAQGLAVRAAHCTWNFGDLSRWWWALAPALPLVAVAVILFVYDRLGAEKGKAPAFGSRASSNWWSNTPNACVSAALMWILAVPGLAWLSIVFHNLWLHPALSLGPLTDMNTVLIGTITVGGLWASVSSSIKGLSAEADRSTFWRSVLATQRQSIAPRLALGLIALLVVGGAATYGAYAMTTPVVDKQAVSQLAGPENSWMIVIAAGVFSLVAAFTSANLTSLNIFYRDRLAYAYLGSTSTFSSPDTKATDAAISRPATGGTKLAELKFSQLGEYAKGVKAGPLLVLCGTANLLDEDLVPTGRNGMSFVMSDGEVGLTAWRRSPGDSQGKRHTDGLPVPIGGSMKLEEYERRNGQGPNLAQAMAISGAAVAPVAGREGRMRPFRVLFALVNVRLGVWLPNPYWNHKRKYTHFGWIMTMDRKLSSPSGLQVLAEAFTRIGLTDPYLYVSDGGHYDNLGLVEALRRRPDRIIVLDGSGDAEDRFPTIGRAMATARMDLDIDIDFDPSPMVRGDKERPKAAHVVGRANYPRGPGCRIDYVKCVLPPDMPWDLEAYRLEHADFPATSASLEMYDEFDFEAFHHLGYELVRRAELN